jgi:hypothetical protein
MSKRIIYCADGTSVGGAFGTGPWQEVKEGYPPVERLLRNPDQVEGDNRNHAQSGHDESAAAAGSK